MPRSTVCEKVTKTALSFASQNPDVFKLVVDGLVDWANRDQQVSDGSRLPFA